MSLPASTREVTGVQPGWLPERQHLFEVAPSKRWEGRMTATADELTEFPFWTPNPHGVTWCVVVDIDEADALCSAWLPGLPDPHWVVESDLSGHVQVGYVVEDVAHGPHARRAPERYLGAVGRSLRRAHGGDEAFTGARCRNPLHSDARAWVREGPALRLGDLRSALSDAGLWDPRPDAGEPAAPVPALSGVAVEGERNQAVFDAARMAAYRGGDAREAAYAVVCEPALPPAEIEGIVRSVERYMARTGRDSRSREGGPPMSDAMRAVQAERGRRGGGRRTEAQRAALAAGPAAAGAVRSAEGTTRAAAIRTLSEQGYTRRQIASAMRCSESTVKRAIRAGREIG